MLSLVTAPATEPLTLVEAKLHCKIDPEQPDDDALFLDLIEAARDYAETATRRRMVSQTWDLVLEDFPCETLELPFPPVTSITSISYLDTAGAAQTWSSALYETQLPAGPWAEVARIRPVYGQIFPATYLAFDAVTVRFVCGYDTGLNLRPTLLNAAMKALVAAMYEKRVAEVQAGEVTWADRVFWQFRSW